METEIARIHFEERFYQHSNEIDSNPYVTVSILVNVSFISKSYLLLRLNLINEFVDK